MKIVISFCLVCFISTQVIAQTDITGLSIFSTNGSTTGAFFTYPGDHHLYIGAGRHGSTKKEIILYNYHCVGGCNVPRIKLHADVVQAYGNLGIGTGTPALISGSSDRILEIEGSSNPGIALHNTNTGGRQYFLYSQHLSGGSFGIFDATASADRLVIDSSGKVGIGTAAPSGQIDINAGSDYPIRTATTNRYIIEVKNTNDVDGGWWLTNDSDGRFSIHENTVGDQLTIKAGGNVGIGTTTPDAKLTVKGEIHAEAVNVDLNVPGPDYVFEDDYPLRSLEETEAYIKAHKHLPEVPSAKEMEARGLDLAQMNMLLLKKIEELTLHQINLLKKIEDQNKRIQSLENK